MYIHVQLQLILQLIVPPFLILSSYVLLIVCYTGSLLPVITHPDTLVCIPIRAQFRQTCQLGGQHFVVFLREPVLPLSEHPLADDCYLFQCEEWLVSAGAGGRGGT